MRIIIPGPPIAKARARTVRRGTFIHTYDPQQQTKQSIRNEIQAHVEKKHEGELPYPCPVRNIALAASFCFFMPYPKECNQWIQNYPIKKPDLDNLEKFYLDCMSGIVFYDDAQIVMLSSSKILSDKPRTEITIMAINNENLHPDINKILTIITKEDVQNLHALTSLLHQKMVQFSFESHPEGWPQTAAQLIQEIAIQFSQKLAKIKKIPQIPATATETFVYKQCPSETFGMDKPLC